MVNADVLPVGVEATRTGERCRLAAVADLAGIATGRYVTPSASVVVELDVSPAVEYLGFAFTQFAMPVLAGAAMDFDFHPAPNLRSPAAVLPLLARDGDRCILLAPITNPHEQIITCHDGVVRWGWHGDLDVVPDGFATDLGIYEGGCLAELMERWGRDVGRAAGVARRPRSANPVTSHLSYWTDNGAAYWYRTEPSRTISDSVTDVVRALRRDDVPIRSVELDSWFYHHEVNRTIAEFGYPDDVPPTGMLTWTPRPDAFAGTVEQGTRSDGGTDARPNGAPDVWHDDGVEGRDDESRNDSIDVFGDRLGSPPLILHARHVAPSSPYVDDSWWVDRAAAHPSDPSFFRRWFDDARRWGAVCIEQDWMLLYWFGVRRMRSHAGTAITWQRALNDHATATDVDLLWCMSTPADLVAAAQFDRVIAVRTCDDYRFAADPALLWTWFLTVNRLVAPLGLWPFKDCFFSHPDPVVDDPITGDVHAELEALLSAMSGGPVGIGDRIGRTDRDIVMRTCDDEGRLLHPDVPIGLIDDCLFGAPARGERLAWARAATTIGTDTWTYVVAINTAAESRSITDTLVLHEVGIIGPAAVYDWRRRSTVSADAITTTLEPRDWALFVCCPAGPESPDGVRGAPLAPGDPTKYVTTSTQAR